MSQKDLTKQELLRFLVVDDHPLILGGTINMLCKHYPHAEILTAKTAEEVLNQVKKYLFDLVVIDLQIPQTSGMISEFNTGIQLLQYLMKTYPNLNIMVVTMNPKALVRIRYDIDNHQGGFTVADKALDEYETLNRVELALKGATHTRDLGTRIAVKPEWLEVLKLAFEEGLQDKAIAERMNVSERTVRRNWTKIQDLLGIYPEDSKKEGKNIRIETEIICREKGLID